MPYTQERGAVLPGFGERDVDLLDAMLDELEQQPWPLASRAGSSSCCSSSKELSGGDTGRDAMRQLQPQQQDLSLLLTKRVRLDLLGTGRVAAAAVAAAAAPNQGSSPAPNSAFSPPMEPRAQVVHQGCAPWHVNGPLSLKRMWEEEVFDDLCEICDAAAAAAWV